MTLLKRALGIEKAHELDRPPLTQNASLGIIGGLGTGLTQFNMLQGLTAYSTVGWLFAVVERIANAVGEAEWQQFTVDRRSERTLIENHPSAELWNQPNPFTTRQEFVETCQQHLDLVGECWWLLLRPNGNPNLDPVEMWPIRPDRMTVVPSREQFIAGYIYRLGAETIPLSVSDVVHLKYPNPMDPYRGIGRVQAILADLDSEKFSAQWNRNFFVNSAQPGGIIEFPEHLSDAQFEEFTMRWNEGHKGVAAAHRVAVLEKGKWIDRKFSMRDMQFKDLRALNRDIILGAFGFPKAILGIAEDVNRANAEAAEVLFTRWLVKPRLNRYKMALNGQLLPRQGVEKGTLVWDFIDPTPENVELRLMVAQAGFDTQSLETNEIRGLLGFDDREGGDDIIQLATPGMKALKAGDPLLDAPIERQLEEMAQAWERRLRRERNRVIEQIEEAV